MSEIVPPIDIDRSSKLTEDFYAYEFDCRNGVPVPEELLPALRTFVSSTVQPLRTFFGTSIRVTSGYRTRAYNDSLAGTAKQSRHIYDENKEGVFAVDIIVRGVSPVEVFQTYEGLVRLGVCLDGGLHAYKNFVHIDNDFRRRWF